MCPSRKHVGYRPQPDPIEADVNPRVPGKVTCSLRGAGQVEAGARALMSDEPFLLRELKLEEVSQARATPDSVGGISEKDLRKDLDGSVRFVPGSQVSTIEWLSGVTPGAMPQVSGVTPGAMPQVSGVTPGAMPQVSGVTPGAMPPVSGVTPGAMPPVSGVTPGAMPQVSEVTPGAMPQVSEVTPGVTCEAMSQELGAMSDEAQDKQAQSSEALVSDAEALKDLTDSVSSMSGPIRKQGGYTKLGPKLKLLRFSLALSPAMQTQGGQTQLSDGQSNEIVRGKGNVNLLLGYERVGRSVVSLLGGEESSLYSLGTSSVATMYRVAGAIMQNVKKCSSPRQTLLCSQDQGAVNRHMGSEQAAFEPPSQIPFVGPIEGSSEAVEDFYQPDGEASRFPGSHLVWFILLSKGTLHAYAGGWGLDRLVICSEGLNTLGWGLGVSSLDKSVRKRPSDSSASTRQEPARSQDPSPSTEGPCNKVSVCKHFIKGWCRRGHACKLHHGDPPDGSSVSTVVGKRGKEEVRKVCPHFLKGNCLRGRSCGYVHTQDAVSSVDANTVQTSEQPAQETQVRCPHFDKGFCRRGQSCRFAHVSNRPEMRRGPSLLEVGRRVKHQPLAEEKKERLRQAGLLDVCFRWAQGRCEAASCRFSHRHLRQWEIELFREMLDGDDAQPEALPADDQAPASTSQIGNSQDQPQQDSVREGQQWDGTVPLLQPAPLILEPSGQNKCRFSAPRPSSSLRKGVKVSMPGSTILRRKLGDYSSTRVMPLSGQQPSRSVLNQPCVLASPPGQPEKFPQHQRTWCRLTVSRSRISGSLKNKIIPGKGSRFPLASYILNPP